MSSSIPVYIWVSLIFLCLRRSFAGCHVSRVPYPVTSVTSCEISLTSLDHDLRAVEVIWIWILWSSTVRLRAYLTFTLIRHAGRCDLLFIQCNWFRYWLISFRDGVLVIFRRLPPFPVDPNARKTKSWRLLILRQHGNIYSWWCNYRRWGGRSCLYVRSTGRISLLRPLVALWNLLASGLFSDVGLEPKSQEPAVVQLSLVRKVYS